MFEDMLGMFKGAIPFLLKKLPENVQDFFAKTGISHPEFIKKIFAKQVTKQDILSISTKVLVHSEKHIAKLFEYIHYKTGEEMMIAFDCNEDKETVEIAFLKKENRVELFRIPITELPEFVNQFTANHDNNALQ